jgi:hypothetical protein
MRRPRSLVRNHLELPGQGVEKAICESPGTRILKVSASAADCCTCMQRNAAPDTHVSVLLSPMKMEQAPTPAGIGRTTSTRRFYSGACDLFVVANYVELLQVKNDLGRFYV